MNNFLGQQYIEYKQIDGTNGKLYMGIFYEIKSRWGTVLDDWGGLIGYKTASLMPESESKTLNHCWTLLPSNQPNWYKIKSLNYVCLDDCQGKIGQDLASLAKDVEDNTIDNRKWRVVPVDGTKVFPSDPDNWFKIESGHQVVLDSRGGKTGQNSAALQKDNFPNENQIWRFFPTKYSIKVSIQDFQYVDNVIDIINDQKRIEIIDGHTIEVDSNSIGSSVVKIFQKSLTNSFSWGLNENLGFSSAVQFICGIPSILDSTLESTFSAEFSSNQEWSSSQTNTISFSSTLKPVTFGTYELIGLVNIANNVKLDYTAKAIVTARGFRVKLNGLFDNNAVLDLNGLQALIDVSKFKNVKIDTHSISFTVKGIMKATFAINTCTILKEKILVPSYKAPFLIKLKELNESHNKDFIESFKKIVFEMNEMKDRLIDYKWKRFLKEPIVKEFLLKSVEIIDLAREEKEIINKSFLIFHNLEGSIYSEKDLNLIEKWLAYGSDSMPKPRIKIIHSNECYGNKMFPPFEDEFDPSNIEFLSISKIIVNSREIINGIQLELYDKRSNKTYLSQYHGGTGGVRTEWQLEEDESIQEIIIEFQNIPFYNCVDALVFRTNKRTTSYGSRNKGSTIANYNLKGSKLIGFFGNSDEENNIRAIGFISYEV